MENFKALKLLCKMEKYLLIRRDFVFLNLKKKIFVSFTVFTDIIVSLLIYIDTFGYVFKDEALLYAFSLLGFQFLYMTQSIFSIVYFAPRFGSDFKKLISCLSSAHQVVKHELTYQTLLARSRMKWVVVLFIFFVFRVLVNVLQLTIIVRQYSDKDTMYHFYHRFLFYLFRNWAEARYVIGVMVYCTLLCVVKSILQSLNVLINEAVDAGSLEEMLNTFVTAYRQLLESTQHLKTCFGHQMVLSLFLALVHFISLVYRLIRLAVSSGGYLPFVRPHSCSHLVVYVCWVMVCSQCGQGVHNAVANLHLTLARIQYKTSTESKAANVRDFLRLVTLKRLDVSLLPPLPVGMYLLPAVLSLTVNYIIVILQLNHDI